MPVTRYYNKSIAFLGRRAYEPPASQSTAFPWGTLNTNSEPQWIIDIDSSLPVEDVLPTTQWNSLNQTARQSSFLLSASYRLGNQTIPAGDWTIAAVGGESNNAANSYFAVSIYVWRPSTSTVVGTIYDSQTQLGVEWSTSSSSRIFTVSGSSVTTQNEDTLIIEIWHTSQQTMGTAYNQSFFFHVSPANSDFTANGQTDLNAWIDAPETLVPYSPPQAPKSYGFIFD